MGESRRYPVALLCMALAACASKPLPPPPPPKPAPVVAAPAPVTKPAAIKPKTRFIRLKPKLAPAAPRPSVADTKTISFAGSIYTLKYQGVTNGESVRQYYTGAETAKNWTRVVELHVYPTADKGISAADYAGLIAKSLQASNPYAEYTLQANKTDGTATLYFTTWNDSTLKAHYTEFDSFKFMPTTANGNVIGFHYAEKLFTDMKASTEDNRKNSEAEKARVLAETAKVPLYQQ